MRFKLAAAALVASAMAPAVARAQCDIRIEAPGQVRYAGSDGTGYQSFENSRFEEPFSIVIANEAGQPCDGLLSIQHSDRINGLVGPPPSWLTYSITRPGSLSTLVDWEGLIGRPPHAIPVTIPAGGTQVQNLALQLPPQQVVPAGTYTQTVLVRLIDTNDLSVVSERSVQLVAVVRSAMSILLYDGAISGPPEAGSRYRRLDFGTLQDGEEASLTVLVQSNDEYEMRFTSTNNGALRHTTAGAGDRVAYTASFGGRALNLASGEAVVSEPQPTGINGVAKPLSVRIGSVGTVRAGRYEDDITITVLPVG